eukprot:4159616-Prymnesium_polylepis.1
MGRLFARDDDFHATRGRLWPPQLADAAQCERPTACQHALPRHRTVLDQPATRPFSRFVTHLPACASTLRTIRCAIASPTACNRTSTS